MLALGEVLLEEIRRSESFEDYPNSWAYWHLLQSATKDDKKQLQQGEQDKLRQLNIKYRSTAELHLLLDKNIEQLTGRIQQIESESLKHKISDICQPYLQYQTV
jgi:heptaprenyl diphosphate synthase